MGDVGSSNGSGHRSVAVLAKQEICGAGGRRLVMEAMSVNHHGTSFKLRGKRGFRM